jgi:hypothetical protein
LATAGHLLADEEIEAAFRRFKTLADRSESPTLAEVLDLPPFAGEVAAV